LFDPRVGLVRVRLESGKMSDLEFLKLSKEDQDYVKEAAAAMESK
jgi:hypothetical protein